jgi:hypothetical protein
MDHKSVLDNSAKPRPTQPVLEQSLHWAEQLIGLRDHLRFSCLADLVSANGPYDRAFLFAQ